MFIILGASKGFGKAILKSLCLVDSKFKITMNDTITLLGRNINTLLALKEECKIKCNFQCFKHNLEDHSLQEFAIDTNNDKYFVFYNSASCDFTGPIININHTDWLKSMNENVWNMCNFSLFITRSVSGIIQFVNISSLCAIQPIEDMGMYSLTKAYREYFFKILTLENPSVRVLNYAPGAMHTDFSNAIRELLGENSETEIKFKTMTNWVDPTASATKLINLIDADTWENNAHIDFHDQSTCPIVSFTRSSSFCSSHKMENCFLSLEENKKCFGKCNSLHGHNYTVNITYKGPIDIVSGMSVDLGEIKIWVDKIILQMDHAHLNDLTHMFKGRPTSCEVIAVVFWEQLPHCIGSSKLEIVKIIETDKQWSEYRG